MRYSLSHMIDCAIRLPYIPSNRFDDKGGYRNRDGGGIRGTHFVISTF
jgi:hypothetical protein